jgi:hypothetical protein
MEEKEESAASELDVDVEAKRWPPMDVTGDVEKYAEADMVVREGGVVSDEG